MNRVLRGGSWINDGRHCRAANRNGNDPANRNQNIGFRPALAPAGSALVEPARGPLTAEMVPPRQTAVRPAAGR